MLLTIDIGNTNIKIALFQGDEIKSSWRISAAQHTADEYGMIFSQLFSIQGYHLKNVTGAILSSVIPSLNYTLEHMIRYFIPDCKTIIVNADLKTGLKLCYLNKAELGCDRIVNSVAAYTLYGGPCIVIDFGTATTFNAINASGEFLGGCICAGIKLSMEALANHTSKLPFIEIFKPSNIIGKTTVENMQSGAVFGLIGQVEYIVKNMKKEKGLSAAKVIATGGLSELVTKESKIIDIIDRTLTLEGLNIIYKLNKEI
jgi:type III pantothenate kinase